MPQCDPFGLLGRILLDTFYVEEFVAEGGYGVVYRAFHKHFRSPIALKVLKAPHGLSPEVERHFWEEFRREAEVQFCLSALTAHVVRPFHIGRVEVADQRTLPVMALEWLEGMDLGAEMAFCRRSGEAPPTLPELLDRLGGAAHAIHLSHNFEQEGGRFSIVHRDIKPENLFVAHVRGREIVKVLDFGTSKVGRMMNLMAGNPTETTQAGQFSPAYAAPEQWIPDSLGQSGPWTDVWGMALTLVELMKGEHVFTGTLQGVMYHCLNERQRPTPRNHGIQVSDQVESVFERALAVDPRERIKTIRDLWVELRSAVNDSGVDDPPSFGKREPASIRTVSDSELPFILARPPPPARQRFAPKTGTFPVLSRAAESETLCRTGTDGAPSDTVRDHSVTWE